MLLRLYLVDWDASSEKKIEKGGIKISTKVIQKTALLGTARILQNVLVILACFREEIPRKCFA